MPTQTNPASFVHPGSAFRRPLRKSASDTLKTKLGLLLLLALVCARPSIAATRHYYIAAEDVTWNYAPSSMNLLSGQGIPQPWAAKTSWNKTRFIEYTDSTFSTRKPQPEWLGILGPVIRGEVGDEIVVDFLNRSQMPHSIHPHGLRYDKASEGALYVPSGQGGRIPPGGHFIYHWFADEGSGPGKGDSSSLVWWYHPHTEEPYETNSGLLGPIIITAKGKAKPDGSPKDVDREFIASFMIFDELQGKDAGLFHAINGYIFGNLPGLVMKQGERVRWYLLAMGNEKDLHTPHWHGKTVEYGNRHTDVVELLPASMISVDMVADNPGTWLFHCQVSDHMESGMMATFTIAPPVHCSSPIQFVSTDLWNTSGKFHITIKNTGAKPIQNVSVSFDQLLGPQYRLRPYTNLWTWNTPIPPGQGHTFEVPGYPADYAQKIFGWVLFPQSATYQDGSRWQLKDESECFEVYWRDKERPPAIALPPLQIQTDED